MPTQVKVECAKCSKVYERSLGKFNQAIKFGNKQYCSSECKNQARITSLKRIVFSVKKK